MNPLSPPEDLAQRLMATHAAYFRECPDGELMRSCLIVCGDGEAIIVRTPWDGPDERAVYLAALRLLMIQKNAVRYAIWSEAWVATGEALKEYDRQRLEADGPVSMETTPGRQECVVTLIVDAGSKTPLAYQQAILRDADGLVRGLEVTPGDALDVISSGLTDLLPERAYQ